MKIRTPREIEYLALEGGGGKGVTYLGAIKALEQFGVLPIDINRPGRNQIKGISGASAGAITAMMLALGMRSEDIQKILGQPSTFTGFFDGPSPGVYRSVSRDNKPVMRSEKPDDQTTLDFVRGRTAKLGYWPTVVSIATQFIESFTSVNDPILDRLLANPEEYLYNLIFDRGLFPGFAPRKFLTNLVTTRLRVKIQEALGGVIGNIGGSVINFEQFYEFTGVDLIITGSNVTRHRPAVFSRRHTPHFPVAEAVGISMNLPMLFKPVHVDANVSKSEFNELEEDYHGFWVDGGLLNNFPLHAFDYLGSKVSSRYPSLRPLHPRMLGLRLTEPATPGGARKEAGVFDALAEHIGNISGAVLYPSEQGQIRTAEEIEQTIDLITYELATTEFAPPPEKRNRPIAEAKKKVLAYFGRG
jgi:NTE family protein